MFNNDQPLLTIAIPTFNRVECLQELLSTLRPQLKGEARVELIISDNASPDRTPELVHSLCAQDLVCRYIRNETNIGSDANFLQCFQLAKGKYVWVLGDDDVILPGAISKILNLLSERNYRLVYLCPYSFRNNYFAERRHDNFRRFAQVIPNGLPFIRKVGTSIAFISGMIANRDFYSYTVTQRPDLSAFIGSNLMHLGWLLPLLGSGGVSLIVWDKVLAARDGNTGGWGICRVFGNSLREVMQVTLEGHDDIRSALLNNTLETWFPQMIIQIRKSSAGSLNIEDFHGVLAPLYRHNWRYWFYVYPVTNSPGLIADCWYRMTQGLNRINRTLRLLLSYPRWRKHLIWNS